MRRLLVLAGVLLSLAGAATAQDRTQTLADIRAELTKLATDIGALKSELNASGNQGGEIAGSVLDRVAALEAEITRLTARTEELDIRINRVVADGTTRIGDLNFRLTELEGGDITKLGQAPPLGGETGAQGGGAPLIIPPSTESGAELAIGEQADFDAAKAKLDAGDFEGAAEGFLVFTQTYPGSPIAADALLSRGDALYATGQTKEAARAYLDAFSAKQDGPKAPRALLKLGLTLDLIGQRPDACLMLREVGIRFPAAPEVTEAQTAMAKLACQ